MTTEETLDLFETCAMPYLSMFERNTCIEQTRILIEVLKRFSVPARPLATKFHLVCKACEFQFFASGDPMDMLRAEALAKGVIKRKNSANETLGYHTVAVVDQRFVVDLTMAQAEAEQFNFRLRPCMLVMPAEEPIAEDYLPDIQAEGVNDEDVSFTMRWIGTDNRDFEKTPAWEPSHLWPLIGIIEKDMWQEWLSRRKAG